MELTTLILFLLAPIPVVLWLIHKKKSNKKIISYSLITALLLGIILQSLAGWHAHVPGSEVIFIVLELLATVSFLVIIFGSRYLYGKFRTHHQNVNYIK